MTTIFNPTPPPPPPPPPRSPSRNPPPPPSPSPVQHNMTTQTNISNIFRQFANNNAREVAFRFGEFQPGTLTSVPILPSEEQINNATISGTFETIENISDQTRCPIDQQEFDISDNILKIRYCGHIFKKHNLMNWFNHSSRCPVCRYDIRDYSNNNVSNNDVSNNDVSNNVLDINNVNLEVILEQTVRNISSGPTLNSMINLANNIANQIIENTDISGAFISNNTNN